MEKKKLDSTFNNWNPPYGAYDCLMNSVIYWFYKLEIHPKSIFSYNWDFYYSSEYNSFGGSISKLSLFAFLDEKCGVNVIEVHIDELIANQWFIISFDSYDLSYIPEFYQKIHQNHFVFAIYKNEEVEFYDSYYKKSFNISKLKCIKLWSRYQIPLIHFYFGSFSELSKVQTPFMKEIDYTSKYDLVQQLVMQQLIRLESIQNLGLDFNYKKYFGNFKSILLNRTNYFQVIDDEVSQYNYIISGWMNVLKNFARLTIPTISRRWNDFSDSLQLVLVEEQLYLDSLK